MTNKIHGMTTHLPIASALTVLAGAMIFTVNSIQGGPIGDVVFTELSSTVLTETLNGTSIGNWTLNATGDSWINNGAGSLGGDGLYALNWSEPENPATINTVLGTSVTSDVAPLDPPTYSISVGNGETIMSDAFGSGVVITVLDTQGNYDPVNVTFIDNGDSVPNVTPAVPEAAPTVLLLMFACGALLAARHGVNTFGVLRPS